MSTDQTNRPMEDQAQRLRALSVNESFIVQAPAGSGKTSLLVQRYLQLLATVQRPEEILAITFTRAAAMEMKQRVLSALQQDTVLTQAIHRQDATYGWMLAQNPNLLKIQTIDSFATELATQIPGSQSAEGMAIEDKPQPLYLQAAQNVLAKLFTADPSNFYVGQFLQALDNNADTADRLLTSMLAKRDQWLDVSRRITGLAISGSGELALTLNNAVSELRETLLAPLHHQLDSDDQRMISRVAQATNRTDDITELMPLILTQAGALRKSVDRRQGEAFTDKAFKSDFLQWLESLEQRNLAPLLYAASKLPGLQEEPEAFDTLIATAVTLAMAAAELEALLQQRRCLDFTGMLMRASAGLEDEYGPTDLALYWDYRISHLLVDEFQDTSRSQFNFFNLLTAGWSKDDGNTFFAVGDPMQSVYRFRDADVSIFSQCWHQGLPNVALEPLKLTSNFRSSPELVGWSNNLFSALFPTDALPHLGAIPFSQAIAQKRDEAPTSVATPAVTQHAFTSESEEASAIAEHVKGLLDRATEDGKEDIGILCRARTHLPLLLQALKQAGIAYTSTDIDSLSAEPIVTDLLSLHRLLLQPSDRLAWFSIFRSPMVGLSLAQLEHFAEASDMLSACHEMKEREPALRRFVSAWTWAQQRLFELPVCEIVEGCWMRLGGVDAYPESDLAHAQAWFDLLEAQQERGWHPDLLLEKTADLYAQDQSHARVKVMTIHKSKGLEFTHVVLPNLGRRGRADEKDLLLWRRTATGLLVGIRDDAVYEWLRFEEKSRSENEVKRLLYVACTRAERSLWLSTASLRKRPLGLAQYLPALAAAENQGPVPENDSDDDDSPHSIPPSRQGLLKHLPDDYQWQSSMDQRLQPQDPHPIQENEAVSDTDEIEDHRSNRFNLALGNLVHLALAFVGEQNQQSRPLDHELLAENMRSWLPKLDAEPHQWTAVYDAAHSHIQSTLAEPTGQWLLQPHQNGQFEWPLTMATHAGPRKIILDRVFRTEEAWWIVDFKTSQPQPQQALADFLAEEIARYSPQLRRYEQALQSLVTQCPEIFTPVPLPALPMKTALYFTGISHLEELAP